MINIKKCEEIFDQYVKNYDFNNRKIYLKYYHTYRVANFCEEIAKSLNLSSDDILLAKLIGMLHDIGRFEQIRIYNTYNDLVSVDHANLGVEVLLENNFIDKFIENNADKEIVLKAVSNHNKFAIEDNLDERTEMFCKIIRDADKLDIIEIFVNQTLIIEENAGEISLKVMNSLEQNETVKNIDVTSKLDDYLQKVALIYDFNYGYSINHIYSKKLITNLIDIIIERNQQAKEKLIIVKEIVNRYLIFRLEEIKC
jgi:putative nucleotidyltransferase with HDIG domain